MATLSSGVIIGGKYEVAMSITEHDMAKEYLDACVEEAIQAGIERRRAEHLERENILHYSKRFNKEVQYRVKKLFSLSPSLSA